MSKRECGEGNRTEARGPDMRRTMCLAVLGALLLAAVLPVSAGAAEAIGKVVGAEGQVTILPSGGGQARQATTGTVLYEGDTLKAAKGSRAKLLMVDDSIITIAESTELKLSEYRLDDRQKTRNSTLSLITGKVRLLVSKLVAHRSQYQVQTPTAVMGVRGTSVIVWTETDPATGKTTTFMLVLDGEISVTGAGVTKDASAGMVIQISEGEAPSDPRPATPQDIENALSGTTVNLTPGQTWLLPGIEITAVEVPSISGPPLEPRFWDEPVGGGPGPGGPGAGGMLPGPPLPPPWLPPPPGPPR
jgi:hypothetical protein